MNKQNGFSAIAGLVIIIVIGAVGFAGWYAVNGSSDDEATTKTNEDTSAKNETAQDSTTTVQTKQNDSVRKNAINAMFQKLEEYYNEHGYYPSEEFSTSLLDNIDPEALIDNEGNAVIQTTSDAIQAPVNPYVEGERPTTGQYTYAAYECTNGSKCGKYTLFGWLEGERPYVKTSLN